MTEINLYIALHPSFMFNQIIFLNYLKLHIKYFLLSAQLSNQSEKH